MSDSAGPRRPNILHLLSDQHSPYVAGCYGDSVVQTPPRPPRRRRVTLDAVYCPSPICVPSRMSMLTGRHPYQNACWTNSHILDSGIPTFAHASAPPATAPAWRGGCTPWGPTFAGLRAPGGRPLPQLRRQPPRPAGPLDGTAGPARVSSPAPDRDGGLPGARRGGDGRRGGLAQPPGDGAPQRPAEDQPGPLPPLRGLHAAPPAVRRPAPRVRALPGRVRPPVAPAVAARAPRPSHLVAPGRDRERHAGGGERAAPTGPWSTAWTP